MSEQIHWAEVRELIEPFSGPISSVRQAGEGFNSQIAVIINERYFVKGLRQDHPRVSTQNREKQINPHVRHLSAELEWHTESDTWNLLGFRYLAGRKADYRPTSPDFADIITMMTRIPTAPADLDLKLAEQRWSSYSDQPSLFAGDRLSHTDWSPGNVVICGDARLIDWAWPTRGAAWIDPACWTVWLVACGHHPAEAEHHAAQVPAFAQAPARALTAFAAAQAAMWAEIADHAPHPGLAAAAAAWHSHRTDTKEQQEDVPAS